MYLLSPSPPEDIIIVSSSSEDECVMRISECETKIEILICLEHDQNKGYWKELEIDNSALIQFLHNNKINPLRSKLTIVKSNENRKIMLHLFTVCDEQDNNDNRKIMEIIWNMETGKFQSIEHLLNQYSLGQIEFIFSFDDSKYFDFFTKQS